jgi:hypothetical protein
MLNRIVASIVHFVWTNEAWLAECSSGVVATELAAVGA